MRSWFGTYILIQSFIPSVHESGGSGGGMWSSELLDLQVDYWLVLGNKKDVNKVLFIATCLIIVMRESFFHCHIVISMEIRLDVFLDQPTVADITNTVEPLLTGRTTNVLSL